MSSNNNRHGHYEVLNLIGYGLSKFGFDLVHAFNFKTKSDFYRYIVDIGIASTVDTVKNRQDLFDGMETTGPRKGWWQKGPVYKHRKDYIDSLFGNLNVKEFVEVIKLSIKETLTKDGKTLNNIEIKASPIIRSSFKQMQETGKEAEYYFMNNYQTIEIFTDAYIDDARLLGDGYDFQLTFTNKYFLVEIKGLKHKNGSIRMTQKEYRKAREYKTDYALVIVRNLIESPVFYLVFDPISNLHFEEKRQITEQVIYYSKI